MTDDKVCVEYELKVHKSEILYEEYRENNVVFFKRDEKGEGTIRFSDKGNEQIRYRLPVGQNTVLNKHGDTIQHGYLKKLMRWAESTRLLQCHTSMGREAIRFKNALEEASKDENLGEVPQGHDLQSALTFEAAQRKHGGTYINSIVSDMRSIGYDINWIGISTPKNIEVKVNNMSLDLGKLIGLAVRENDLRGETFQRDMSMGMFRALSVIIHINYFSLENKGNLLLIDVIGEGLDHARSKELIRLVIEKSKKSEAHMQVIMTTNDEFVMNNVDLKYWSIIKRTGHKVHCINEKNGKEFFDRFKFYGLNNFEFFSRELYSAS
jgi:hypothetical protein